MKIADCVAIVTGGASGLGAATAEMLGGQGAKVAIIDTNEMKGGAMAAKIGAEFFKADIADEAELVDAMEKIESTLGTARILVSCAGVAPAIGMFGHHGPHPMEAFRRTIDVNLIGTFAVLLDFASRVSALQNVDGERGIAIVTSSIAAFDGQKGLAAYSASKAGLGGMILPIALDLADREIRVMGIAPGLFQTPLLDGVPGADRIPLFTQVPHPARSGAPEEFAHLVRAIIENPMLNGTVIRVDGGLRLAPA